MKAITYPTSSLVVSTYNWPEALRLCLESIMIQEELPNEVIIADDGSAKETGRLIAKYQKMFPIALRHIWQEDLGFRKTVILNKAIAAASGDYVIQIDGDIVLHSRFVKDHLVHARKGVFVKGSRALIGAKRSKQLLRNKKACFTPFSTGIKNRFNALRIPFLSSLIITDECNPRDVKGCNMAFWKADFVGVNGYENNLNGWGHEDIELAARFINKGIRKYHLKLAAICYHIHHNLVSRISESSNLNYYEYVVKHQRVSAFSGYHEVLRPVPVRVSL
ncbi:glycosyltransferase family 2 protein [Olivibacter sitiensis]|uniref:glycosyltransferase family 2 protein n=1 Tax=Olivibacter sitiensis TaxID=376470 RepID=UPI001FE0E968|nr:glycosyltransferase family 2 protein [Olivibacter sitiensis]